MPGGAADMTLRTAIAGFEAFYPHRWAAIVAVGVFVVAGVGGALIGLAPLAIGLVALLVVVGAFSTLAVSSRRQEQRMGLDGPGSGPLSPWWASPHSASYNSCPMAAIIPTHRSRGTRLVITPYARAHGQRLLRMP